MAGGSGTRMGLDGNKVYLPLGGRAAIELPLATLAASASVGAIVLVVRAGDEGAAGEVVGRAGGGKVRAVVPGGASRHLSERAGLAAVRRLLTGSRLACSHVAIHDGARPFLTHALLDALVDAARATGGALPVLGFADPLAVEAADGSLSPVPPGELVRVQTPQVFPLGPLLDAYERAAADGFDGVDTAEVVERYRPDVACAAVPGDDRNLKVTTPGDLATAEALATVFASGRWTDR
jgi:2-C-methyl-D-erythritol 4-phosphate cytidylyltransferase